MSSARPVASAMPRLRAGSASARKSSTFAAEVAPQQFQSSISRRAMSSFASTDLHWTS
jgi:hypothetical protein